MKTLLRPALSLFVALTLLTGVLYPLAITGVAQAFFPGAANGSVLERHGVAVGSSLIGQPFQAPGHFWSRPSATSPMPNNGDASAGSNQGPANPALVEAVKGRVAALRAADPGNTAPVPVDLATASASGLDPHISVAAARWQVARVARATRLPLERVQALVDRRAEEPLAGWLGEARVNVLLLNLDLDDALAR
jgi:potassium-transporting ATPase KdpC subunit